jgi:DNA polymerase-3 subunit gamma/tau
LYRKHRPQRFDELVGQEHVTTALRNAVREGRVGHAYLFTGPRGTGKTSTARILAKALNCANRHDDGEPCNECASCIEVAGGSSFDVIELDAASSNKVDDMRDVLERVAYRSAGGAYKIYILDEVHMLGPGASAALLKTLEEPPEHVVFILATTDPQKVLPTIRSRTQKFDFTLMPTDTLAELVRDVAAREGVATDDDTVLAIARQAAGSGRDALSLLDQALAYGNGRLDAVAVRDLFGGTPFDRRAAVFDAILSEDPAGVLAAVDDVLATGTGVRQLADDLLRYLRDVFVLSSGRGRVRLEATEEEQKQLLHHGETFHGSGVLRAMETIGEAVVEMRTAPDPRLVLEVALVRLARREAGTPVEALLDRVSHLERSVEELRSLAAGIPAVQPAPTPAKRPAAPRTALGALRDSPKAEPTIESEPGVASEPVVAPEPPPAPAVAPAGGAMTLDDVVLAWPNVLAGLGRSRLKAFAQEAQPVGVEGDIVVLGLPSKFSGVHKPTIEGDRATLCEALTRELGRAVGGLKVVLDDGFVGNHDPLPDRARPPSDAAADPDADIDHRDLVDVPAGAEATDTIESRLIDTFAATVEDEIVRES